MRVLRRFDPWGNPLCTCPPKYSLAPYTGCTHMCLYCYAATYIGVKDSTPKKDFLRNLTSDLRKAERSLFVSMSNSSDPYPPAEARLGLTRDALGLLIQRGFRVLVVTKSDLFVRDLDIIAEGRVSVSVTVTTLDESLARVLEPGAPPPHRRVDALARAARAGIPVSARVDPVIPGLNDDPSEVRELIHTLKEAGVRHVVTSTLKLKPRILRRLGEAFPDMHGYWKRLYVDRGVRVRSYLYLEAQLRRKLLGPVVEEARKLGMTYATCREGLGDPSFFSAPSCDGSHLIP